MKKRIIALILIVISLLSLCSCTFDKEGLEKTKNKIEYEFNRKSKIIKEKVDKKQDELSDALPKYDLNQKKDVEEKWMEKTPSNND